MDCPKHDGSAANQLARVFGEHLRGIPIDDPAAALRFCRSLACLLCGDGTDSERPELSIVIPVYNEEENLIPLYDRLSAVLEKMGCSYEIVFVDDGSRDRSVLQMREFARQDHRVQVVELARNFGHQIAISAGLDFARGRGIVVMDADLQDPPEMIPEFFARWKEGHDVVYAVRTRRKEGAIKRLAYASFYRLLRSIANIDIPLDSGDFCLMDRRVVELLTAMPERNRFVRGIRAWVGLNQIGLPYERDARHAGRSHYSWARLMSLALDGLISFSFAPLRLISILGICISCVSLTLAAFYFVKKLVVGLNPPGFATLVVALLFLSGVQLITIGVIGEYVGRIFEEVKRRPLYVVRRVTYGNRHAYPDAE